MLGGHLPGVTEVATVGPRCIYEKPHLWYEITLLPSGKKPELVSSLRIKDCLWRNFTSLLPCSLRSSLIFLYDVHAEKFKYFGITVRIQKLFLWIGFYRSVKTCISSRLLSKNLKIKMFLIRVFERRTLFESNWKEVTGEWKKLHSEYIHRLYS